MMNRARRDAYRRFFAWYWKYTIRPRFTNIPRKIHYWLFHKKTVWDDKYASSVFYRDGEIPPSTLSRGVVGPSFKEWWGEHAASNKRESQAEKKALMLRKVKELRGILKTKPKGKYE